MSAIPFLVGWPIIRAVGDHVWQSTLVAVIAGLLTLAFRRNRAAVRYGLWCAASLKFLVPFAALTALGVVVAPARAVRLFAWRPNSVEPVVSLAFNTANEPFSAIAARYVVGPAPFWPSVSSVVPLVLLTVWLVGVVAILSLWHARWRQINTLVRSASSLESGRELALLRQVEQTVGIRTPIGLVSPTTSFEPGVFGVVKPVLMWSRSMSERLSDEQMRAIVAHEVAHVRRRDNLSATLHMLVEAIFWFHPLVWWLGARLLDERERACDEEVIRLGSSPLVYAESLIKTCEFYVKSSLVCIAGVTGSDLKARIERIMTNRGAAALGAWRRGLLAAVGIAGVAGPIAIGALNAQPLHAQAPAAGAVSAAFEVASIKLDKTSSHDASFGMPADRFVAHNVPLRDMMAWAYGEGGFPPRMLADYQIVGGPAWVRTDMFDVVAKSASDVPQGPEGNSQKRLMVQALLAERFKLVVHHEQREAPIYALVLARIDGRLGPQLRRSTVDCEALMAARGRGNAPSTPPAPGQPPACVMQGQLRGGLMARGQPMAMVANFLASFGDRLVIDGTGLTGSFDLDLRFRPEDLPGLAPPPGADRPLPSEDAPSLFAALQEQLGLKLESTKGPVDVLVIDSVEHPSED